MSNYDLIKQKIVSKLALTPQGFKTHMSGMDFKEIKDADVLLEQLKSEGFIDFDYYLGGIDYASIKLL